MVWLLFGMMFVSTNLMGMEKKEQEFIYKAYRFLEAKEHEQLFKAIKSLQDNKKEKHEIRNASRKSYEKARRDMELRRAVNLRFLLPPADSVLFSYGDAVNDKLNSFSVIVGEEKQDIAFSAVYKFMNDKFQESFEHDMREVFMFHGSIPE